MRRENRIVLYISLGILLVVGGVLLSTSVRVKKDDTSPKEVEQNPQKAKDTFYYNGDNIKEYKGESIFYVDMERQLTEKQGSQLEKKEKTLSRKVKTIVVSDKYDDMFSLEFIWYFSNVEKIVVGEKASMYTLISTQDYQYAKLKEIQISQKNKECFSVDGAAYGEGIILLVPQKWEKKKLIIPSQVTYVNTQQIYGSKIEEIVLHNNIQEVASQDASLWEGGDSPEWGYGENEFQEQRQLKKISLQKGSKYYKMKDGVLYRKEGNGKYEFEGYPVASRSRKKVRILEGTTRLGALFTEQKGLKLVLPKSLKKFRDDFIYSKMNVSVKKGSKYFVQYRNGIYNKKKTVLYYYYHQRDKMATVYFPVTLEKIKSDQFFRIKKLNVYVKGGKQSKQWRRLKKQCWHSKKKIVHSY